MDFTDCFVRDDSDALRAYIEGGGNVNLSLNAPIELDLPYCNKLVGSLIHHSIIRRATKCLKVLISAGADLESREDCGSTPLLTACSYGYIEGVLILLRNGANVNAITRTGRWGPLHCVDMGFLAPIEDKITLVKILVDFGADRNLRDSYDGIPGRFLSEGELLDTFRNYSPCNDVKDPGID